MVYQANIDKRQGLLKVLCKGNVGLAGRGAARGVIMSQNQRGGMVLQRFARDLARPLLGKRKPETECLGRVRSSRSDLTDYPDTRLCNVRLSGALMRFCNSVSHAPGQRAGRYESCLLRWRVGPAPKWRRSSTLLPGPDPGRVAIPEGCLKTGRADRQTYLLITNVIAL